MKQRLNNVYNKPATETKFFEILKFDDNELFSG